MPFILIVDDERDLAELLDFNLRGAGFETAVAASGEAALAVVRHRRPDLALLDLMLPDISGHDLCRKLKSEPALAGVPVMMVTAKVGEDDRVEGFETGADDYVTKPFSVRELVLRVKAILKRTTAAAPPPRTLHAGALVLELDSHRCFDARGEVRLTTTEFKLLHSLLVNAGRVRTRQQLMAEVWGITAATESRTVDTTMMRLREKLGDGGGLVETVRGVGYRVATAPHQAQ